MSYSCTDLADDVFETIADTGAVHSKELEDEDLDDNPGLQSDLICRGIQRLTRAKDALAQYRAAVIDFAARNGISLNDEMLQEADGHASAALAEIESRAQT